MEFWVFAVVVVSLYVDRALMRHKYCPKAAVHSAFWALTFNHTEGKKQSIVSNTTCSLEILIKLEHSWLRGALGRAGGSAVFAGAGSWVTGPNS